MFPTWAKTASPTGGHLRRWALAVGLRLNNLLKHHGWQYIFSAAILMWVELFLSKFEDLQSMFMLTDDSRYILPRGTWSRRLGNRPVRLGPSLSFAHASVTTWSWKPTSLVRLPRAHWFLAFLPGFRRLPWDKQRRRDVSHDVRICQCRCLQPSAFAPGQVSCLAFLELHSRARLHRQVATMSASRCESTISHAMKPSLIVMLMSNIQQPSTRLRCRVQAANEGNSRVFLYNASEALKSVLRTLHCGVSGSFSLFQKPSVASAAALVSDDGSRGFV